jgi:adenylate cyclase
VVLPFKNLGTIAGSDLMADGLTYEVTSILGRVEGLDVVPAASAFTFKDKPRDVTAIHSLVKADMAIDGELFTSDNRVRVLARLVSLTDNRELWSEPIESHGKDALEIQVQLALAIVNRLRLKLGSVQRRYELDSVLQTKFLKARSLASTHEPDRLVPEAVSLFEEIITKDRSYAPAWAGLASALGSIVRLRAADDLIPRMKEAALEAYRLDPFLAEANAALGVVQARDLEWGQARESFAKALDTNRSLTWIYTDAVINLLMPLGRFDEAIELLEIARIADPFSLEVRRALAVVQVDAGQYGEAIENLTWVLERDPTYAYAANRLGRAYALSGRYDDALRVFAADRAGSGPGYAGYVYAVTGRREEAEAIAAHPANNPGWQLLIYGGLRDKDRAFEALDRLVARNPWRAATWMLRPEVAVIRDDPRFNEIRRRLKIPQ